MGNEPILLDVVRSAGWEIAPVLANPTHGPGKLVKPVAEAPRRPDRGAGRNPGRRWCVHARGVLCNLLTLPGSRRTPITNGAHVLFPPRNVMHRPCRASGEKRTVWLRRRDLTRAP